MFEWLNMLFSTEGFMPHGHCYLWKPGLLWMHVISDTLIFLSYAAIPFALAIFVKKREDLPFSWIFILFSVFIIACGFTHLLAVITVWHPTYWLTGIVKALTAIASLLTAMTLFPLLPKALAIPSPAMLKTANQELSSQITERLKVELQIKEKNADLESVNKALTESLNNLRQTQKQLIIQEKMASLGGLVVGIAHEINTPIGIGITAASHLSDVTDILSTKFEKNNITREYFSQYIKDAKQSSTLINSNLMRAAKLIENFKKVAVDQTNKNLRIFNIKTYLNEILLSLHPKLKKLPYKINLQCAEKIEVYGEPGALFQILTNLILNSLTHGFENAENGSIEIKVNQLADTIQLIYHDSGRGISREHQQKIYDPFFTTKRGQGGSGLGMHIVYNQVTQSLKGSIKCDSELGKGTQFTIYFPNNLPNN